MFLGLLLVRDQETTGGSGPMVEIIGALGRQAPSDRVRRRRGRRAGESEPAAEIAMKVWILRTLAAINSKATRMLWAAVPNSRRRPASSRASWAGSLTDPFIPSLALLIDPYMRRHRSLPKSSSWRYLAPASGGRVTL